MLPFIEPLTLGSDFLTSPGTQFIASHDGDSNSVSSSLKELILIAGDVWIAATWSDCPDVTQGVPAVAAGSAPSIISQC